MKRYFFSWLLLSLFFSQSVWLGFVEASPTILLRGIVSKGPGTLELYIDDPLGDAEWIKWRINSTHGDDWRYLSSSQISKVQLGLPVVIDPFETVNGGNILVVETENDFELQAKSGSSGVPFAIQSFPFFHGVLDIRTVQSQTVLVEEITEESEIDGLSGSELWESTQHFDGLGKSIMQIDQKRSPNGDDIVSYSDFNEMGLATKSHLAFAKTHDEINGDHFFPNANTQQQAFYQSPPSGITPTNAPFAETILDETPLLRSIEQGGIGTTWQPGSGHSIQTAIRSNETTDNIRIWTFDEAANTATSPGTYDEDEITVKKTIDENQNESVEYYDKSENLILRRSTVSGSSDILTYNVYDSNNNLRMIIPPMGVAALESNNWNLSAVVSPDITTTIQDRWVTTFLYDGYQRLIEKRIPEMSGPVSTVYDHLGRTILTQDPNLATNSQWSFTKYDVQGRVILTGIYTDPQGYSRAEMQDTVDQYVNGTAFSFYEFRDNNGTEGYTDTAFPPIALCQIWSVTYYDDYPFPGAASFAYIQDVDFDPSNDKKFDRLRGLVTGSKVRVLGETNVFKGSNRVFGAGHTPQGYSEVYYQGDQLRLTEGFHTQPNQTVNIGPNVTVPQNAEETHWLTSVQYYDKYGRVIQTQSQNHLGGTDVGHTLYDFAGKVLNTKVVHNSTFANVTVEERYEYDHAGRVTEVYHSINGAPEVLMVANQYNELGTPIVKELHSTDSGTNFLQTVDFQYNERGWLTAINNPDNLGSDLFALALEYDSSPSGITTSSEHYQFNGNISGMVWKSASDNAKRGYSYRYDDINQLAEANFARHGGTAWDADVDQFSVSGLQYDLNGNIAQVLRNGQDGIGGAIDHLTYTYGWGIADSSRGNTLYAVDDALDNTTAGHDFEDNGNEFGTGGILEYDYDPNGNMTRDLNKGIQSIAYNELNLPVVVDFGEGNRIEWVYSASGAKLRKTVYFAGGLSTVTDYSGSFVYEDEALDFFHTTEGRVEVDGSNFDYQYALKDHLGNVRVMFNESVAVTQDNHYYPFGMRLGLGSTGGSDNKFLYNGKELEAEHGLNWYHYGARYYDPQLGRWHAVDPADEFHSQFVYVGNTPIIATDKDGFETYVNIYGEILTDFRILNPDDPSVILVDKKGKWSKIGRLGGEIDITGIFDNLVATRYEEAKSLFNPLLFMKYVETGGAWDIKNNVDLIFGVANDNDTWYNYYGEIMRPDAPGNILYGVVGLAFGDNYPAVFFSEGLLQYAAGWAQLKDNHSKDEWIKGPIVTLLGTKLPPFKKPFADDPIDQYYIRKGFELYWLLREMPK